jgi:glycosyltransferase involved in cell wall biosynthesis
VTTADSGEIVWFSPMPPQQNGIADYSFEILARLVDEFDCTVVVDDCNREARAPKGIAVLAAAEYRYRPRPAALHIYQIGNSPDHVYMLPFLAERPGLAVVHDPVLHHLLDCATMAVGDYAGYVDALACEYGAVGQLLGQLWWLREQRMHFDLPMLAGLLGPARGVVTHSRFAAGKVMARVPDAEVTVVPHQFSPPAAHLLAAREATREALGVSPGEVLFVSLGFVGSLKRIDIALRALALRRARLPSFRYLIAGKLDPAEYDVVAMAAAEGLADCLITPGFVPDSEFFALLQAADVVINLRHPIAGETSGTVIRALGMGAVVVVVDRGAFAEIPDGAAVKVRWGADIAERLGDELVSLANNPKRRRAIGEAARSMIASRHAATQTVAAYRSAIARAQSRPARPWATPCVWAYPPPAELTRRLERAIADHDRADQLPLWLRSGAMPLCDPVCRIAWLGSDDRDRNILVDYLGFVPRFVDLETAASRAVDLAMIVAQSDRHIGDLGGLFITLNRVIAFGGLALIDIARPPASVEPWLLEQPDRGERLFEAFGFRVEFTTATAPPSLLRGISPPVSVERCWRAVKISEFLLGAESRARARAAARQASG